MPIRYDQSQCCSKLAAKQRSWQGLRGGLRPGDDNEIPVIEGTAGQLEANAEAARHKAASSGVGAQTLKPLRPLPAGIIPPPIEVVINHKTGVLHMDPPCNYIRNFSLSHYEKATEEAANVHLYQRRERCFKPSVEGQGNIIMPDWENLPNDEAESAQSDSAESGASSSS